jgi:hypothetical protein
MFLQSHTDGDNCLVISGTSSPGPSDIKVWHHTQLQVGPFLSAYHPNCSTHFQVQLAAAVQKDEGISRYKVWQICLIGVIISVGMNQAIQYMPLLQAWIVRNVVAWGANGTGFPSNATDATTSRLVI